MNAEDLLQKLGLSGKVLTEAENKSLERRLNVLKQQGMTVQKIKENLEEMRDIVEKELVETPEFNYIFLFKVPNRKQILLKARLQNYLLLLAFMDSPEKARVALERAVLASVS